MVRDHDTHGYEDAVDVQPHHLAFLVDIVLSVNAVPHDPNEDACHDRVEVEEEDDLQESLPVGKLASVRVKLRHLEWKVLLFLDCSVVLERDLLVENAVVQDEPVSHQDVDEGDEQVIHRLMARCTTCELVAILGYSVDDIFHEHQDREVLDSPTITSSVPEKTTA